MIKHLLVLVCMLTLCTTMLAQQYGTLKDSRDGRVYKTVKIGEQEWMAENFDGTRFRNGDVIPQVKTLEEWRRFIKEKKPAWCYNFTGEKATNKLYNVWAVFDPRGLAPKGWHLPEKKEVLTLNEHFYVKTIYKDSVTTENKIISPDTVVAESNNGEYIPNIIIETDDEQRTWVEVEEKAGQKLRAVGWGDGNNESGFNAKPFKCINGNTGKVIWGGYTSSTYWWMQKLDGKYISYMRLNDYCVGMQTMYEMRKTGTFIEEYLALSVRFIKD